MKRVTGIGGVFFKAKDPKALAEWYRTHLGMKVEDWGGVAFRRADDNPRPRHLRNASKSAARLPFAMSKMPRHYCNTSVAVLHCAPCIVRPIWKTCFSS